MIFARKINKNFRILHDICPKKINKMPEFYMIFARKIFFPNFGRGRGKCPPSTVSYAYGGARRLSVICVYVCIYVCDHRAATAVQARRISLRCEGHVLYPVLST